MNEDGGTLSPLVDIGLNLTSSQFKKDVREVLARAAQSGVIDSIVTGTSESASAEAITLCRAWNDNSRPSSPDFLQSSTLRTPHKETDGNQQAIHCRLFCTAGVHPHEARSFSVESSSALRALATAPEVVAIGETGLDFNRDFSPRRDQERAFETQLELAAAMDMPVFLHERDAHDRQLAILKQFRDRLCGAVVHCFTGGRQALFNYLDLDLYVGITGWICDERRGRELQGLVASIPADRLLVETDAPYLLPRTLAKKPANRRNEPAFLGEVVKKLARHRDEPAAEVAKTSTANAYRLFRLPPISPAAAINPAG